LYELINISIIYLEEINKGKKKKKERKKRGERWPGSDLACSIEQSGQALLLARSLGWAGAQAAGGLARQAA
jgi:hypothetical protein